MTLRTIKEDMFFVGRAWFMIFEFLSILIIGLGYGFLFLIGKIKNTNE